MDLYPQTAHLLATITAQVRIAADAFASIPLLEGANGYSFFAWALHSGERGHQGTNFQNGDDAPCSAHERLARTAALERANAAAAVLQDCLAALAKRLDTNPAFAAQDACPHIAVAVGQRGASGFLAARPFKTRMTHPLDLPSPWETGAFARAVAIADSLRGIHTAPLTWRVLVEGDGYVAVRADTAQDALAWTAATGHPSSHASRLLAGVPRRTEVLGEGIVSGTGVDALSSLWPKITP